MSPGLKEPANLSIFPLFLISKTFRKRKKRRQRFKESHQFQSSIVIHYIRTTKHLHLKKSCSSKEQPPIFRPCLPDLFHKPVSVIHHTPFLFAGNLISPHTCCDTLLGVEWVCGDVSRCCWMH